MYLISFHSPKACGASVASAEKCFCFCHVTITDGRKLCCVQQQHDVHSKFRENRSAILNFTLVAPFISYKPMPQATNVHHKIQFVTSIKLLHVSALRCFLRVL